MTSNDIARLVALGLNAKEASAYVVLWSSERMEILLDYTFSWVRDNGFSAVDAYDMVTHGIHSRAIVYLRGGFTGHQAVIIENDPQAHRNLYGQRRTQDQVNALLLAPIRADYKTNVLRTATSPTEARRRFGQFENLLNNFDRNHDRLQQLNADAAFLVGLIPTVDLDCECR